MIDIPILLPQKFQLLPSPFIVTCDCLKVLEGEGGANNMWLCIPELRVGGKRPLMGGVGGGDNVCPAADI